VHPLPADQNVQWIDPVLGAERTQAPWTSVHGWHPAGAQPSRAEGRLRRGDGFVSFFLRQKSPPADRKKTAGHPSPVLPAGSQGFFRSASCARRTFPSRGRGATFRAISHGAVGT